MDRIGSAIGGMFGSIGRAIGGAVGDAVNAVSSVGPVVLVAGAVLILFAVVFLWRQVR